MSPWIPHDTYCCYPCLSVKYSSHSSKVVYYWARINEFQHFSQGKGTEQRKTLLTLETVLRHAMCWGHCPITFTSSTWVMSSEGRVQNPHSRKQTGICKARFVLKVKSLKREDEKGFWDDRNLLSVQDLLLSKAAECWGKKEGAEICQREFASPVGCWSNPAEGSGVRMLKAANNGLKKLSPFSLESYTSCVISNKEHPSFATPEQSLLMPHTLHSHRQDVFKLNHKIFPRSKVQQRQSKCCPANQCSLISGKR